MPVTITVSEVRQALYQAAGAQSACGDGAPSLAVLGQWFHEAVALADFGGMADHRRTAVVRIARARLSRQRPPGWGGRCRCPTGRQHQPES